MEPLISFQNVNHWFGAGALRKQILHNITADFLPGEIVILTGPSGSGKTTTLTLAGGLRSVQEGSLKIFGRELNGVSVDQLVQLRRKIGFIFQAHNLLDSLTALQNVEISLSLHEPITAASHKKIEAMLDAVGLGGLTHRYPRELSIGQKQRVAIARALIGNPQIILADEPTASLDKKSGREVIELLHNLARKQKCAILLVTHDNRILDVADRMMSLEDGRLSSFAKGLADSAGQMFNSLALIQRRGDLARHMETMSDRQFVHFLEESTQELEQLLRAIDLGHHQISEAMLDQVLEVCTKKIGQLLQAERGTIFLVDHEKQLLRSKIAQSSGDKPLEIIVPMTRGIAAHVALTGEMLNIADAYTHPLFNPDTDKKTGFHTRNILCMPIYNRARKILAVTQFLNKKDGAFTMADERRLQDFVPSISVILETCLRLEKRNVPEMS